jgi:hypothetical protein
MRKKYPSIVRALLVLALIVSLTGVLAVLPVSATTVGLTTQTGPVGTPVTVNVTNAAVDNGQPITVLFDGVPLATTPAAAVVALGEAHPQIVIPAASGGPTHLVRVLIGATPYDFTFTVESKVTITPLRGPVLTSATVKGTGFTPGTTATITVGGQAFASGVPVDSTGSFEAADQPIPVQLTAGDQVVDAIDGNSMMASTYGNAASFKVEPTLKVDPASGLAGKATTLSGSGFAAGTVTFAFAGVGWNDPAGAPYTATVGATGVLAEMTMVVPASALPGVKTVVATDAGGNQGMSTFEVLPRPLIVKPASGPKGTKVLIEGSQMTKSTTTTPVNNSSVATGDLEINGAAWNTGAALPTGEIQPGTIYIDTTGKISPTTAYIPCTAIPGANTINANDGGADFNAATLADNLHAFGQFTVTKPTIDVTPLSGPRGMLVTVMGSGWVPNSTVTITFGTTTKTASVDGNGNFGAGINVPNVPDAGVYDIDAMDQYCNTATTVKFTVPDAEVTVTPSEGVPGQEPGVTIAGTGFLAYATVDIWIGTAQLSTRPLTDVFGAFSVTTVIPGQPEGAAVVMASTGAKNATTSLVIMQAPETVESAMATIMDQLEIVWGYVTKNDVLDWYFFDPDDPEGSQGPQGLPGLVAGKGYWVKVTEAITLIFSGHQYPLDAGWNNIGWRGR